MAAIVSRLLGLPRWAHYGIAVVLLALAALAWLALHDRAVVRNHDAKRTAEVTGRVIEAERTATRNDEARRETRETKAREIDQAKEEAIRANPDEAGRVAGPAVRAVLGQLREQAARDRNAAS